MTSTDNRKMVVALRVPDASLGFWQLPGNLSLSSSGAGVADWSMPLRCPLLPTKVNTPHCYSNTTPHKQIYNNDFG